jgi:outer membrane protein
MLRTLALAVHLTFGLAAAVPAEGPARLTLAGALRLAMERNGQVRAAALQVEASRARVTSAFAAFLPVLTPSFTYDTSYLNRRTGGSATVRETTAASDLTASLRLLDFGERDLNLRASRRSAEAQEFSALHSIRTTLFQVHQRYFDALRAQELQRVQQAQLDRARTILQQTETRVELGDAARIAVLQARADYLIAQASVLGARNRVATAHAELKAAIGWEEATLPELEPAGDPRLEPPAQDLETTIGQGLERRADLLGQRRRIESQESEFRLTQLDGAVQFSVDANFRRSFSPDVFDRGALVLQASIPLYDGARSQANVRAARAGLDASRAQLVQSEREARAEIESAYIEFVLNQQRLVASAAALEAAQINFEAARESQRAGASNLIEVLTAQLSLVTAEVNNVEAVYDALVSSVRLRLATGETIPGEI